MVAHPAQHLGQRRGLVRRQRQPQRAQLADRDSGAQIAQRIVKRRARRPAGNGETRRKQGDAVEHAIDPAAHVGRCHEITASRDIHPAGPHCAADRALDPGRLQQPRHDDGKGDPDQLRDRAVGERSERAGIAAGDQQRAAETEQGGERDSRITRRMHHRAQHEQRRGEGCGQLDETVQPRHDRIAVDRAEDGRRQRSPEERAQRDQRVVARGKQGQEHAGEHHRRAAILPSAQNPQCRPDHHRQKGADRAPRGAGIIAVQFAVPAFLEQRCDLWRNRPTVERRQLLGEIAAVAMRDDQRGQPRREAQQDQAAPRTVAIDCRLDRGASGFERQRGCFAIGAVLVHRAQPGARVI